MPRLPAIKTGHALSEMNSGAGKSVRFVVSGTVQGVFFRAATQEQARKLGLAGYVENRHDGRVEVHARGASDSVEALERWLWQGPPNAEVTAVEVVHADPCLLYTSPSPRDGLLSRMPSSA